MPVRRALKLSMVITSGHRGDLFVMYLSFLGWMLLCIPTLGLGFLWFLPYMYLSFAHAYEAMKQEALDSGFLAGTDFGDGAPAAPVS
jgi:uncharacterized membrane protein